MRSPALVVAVVALALAFAAAAGATIVLQKGIAGVRIGMSQTKVRSVLHKPLAVEHGKNAFGRYTELVYDGLVVTFQGNTAVTNISTTRITELTASGVGVGSTEAQLKAKVKGLTCKTEHRSRHCFLGKFLAGRRVTDFAIKRHRVTRVDVGLVID